MTVADCLKLPALREAKVIAGHEGLDQFVVTVSVLEYAKISAMPEVLFLGNELILTAFSSVKDSVEEQCAALCRLQEVGESGIIIYYVGRFLPSISPELIALANERGFPLIVMPKDVYEHRYSEVITEVLEAIFEEKKRQKYFVTTIMELIARMGERQRTLDSVLRILSDRLRCSFWLLNREGEERGFASWPMASKERFLQVLERERRTLLAKGKLPQEIKFEDHTFFVYRQFFDTTYQKKMELMALDEGGLLNEYSMEQAVEVLQMYGSIWHTSFDTENEDALVQAILNNQPLMMKRIAAKYHIDLSKIRIMWVMKERKNGLLQDALLDMRGFLKEQQKHVIIDELDHSVIAFMNEEAFLELDTKLAHCFMEEKYKNDRNRVLFWCGGLDSTQEVRRVYVMIEDCFPVICHLYPSKTVFTEAQLRFTKECLRILNEGEEEISKYQQVLHPLFSHKDKEDLLDTLSVYFLDADRQISLTASILFLHESTVKYRLNKIKQKLGYEIDHMPGQYNLYLAVALRRLT